MEYANKELLYMVIKLLIKCYAIYEVVVSNGSFLFMDTKCNIVFIPLVSDIVHFNDKQHIFKLL